MGTFLLAEISKVKQSKSLIKMPTVIQRQFMDQVVELNERNDVCREFDTQADLCDQLKVMLICAYIELIFPSLTIIGSLFFRKEARHIWGSNLPQFACVAAGSLYLSLYYGDNLFFDVDTHMMFKGM